MARDPTINIRSVYHGGGSRRFLAATRGMTGAANRAAQAIGLGVVNMLGNKLVHAMDGAVAAMQRGKKEFIAVEQQSFMIGTIGNMSTKQINQMEGSFQKLAQTLPLSTSELMTMSTELMRTGSMFKKDFLENFEKTGPVMSDLVMFSRRANSTMSETGSIFGVLAQQAQMNGESLTTTMGRLTAQMTVTANRTPADARFVMRGAQRVLKAGTAYKIASKDILQLLGHAKGAGMEAMTAGNNLSTLIEKLMARGNTGRLAGILGITAGKLNEMKAADPGGTFMKMAEGLRATISTGKLSGIEQTELFEKLGLGAKRAKALARAVFSVKKEFGDLNNAYEEAAKRQNDLNVAQAKTLSGLMATLQGTKDILAGAMFKIVAPLLKGIIIGINKFVGALIDLQKAHPVLGAIILGLGGMVLLVLVVVGTILKFTAALGFAFLGIQSIVAMLSANNRAFQLLEKRKLTDMQLLKRWAKIVKWRATRATKNFTTSLVANTKAHTANAIAMAAGGRVGHRSGGKMAAGTMLAGDAALVTRRSWSNLGLMFKKVWKFMQPLLTGIKGLGKLLGVGTLIFVLVDGLGGLWRGLKDVWDKASGFRSGLQNLAEGIWTVISPLFKILELFGALVGMVVEFIVKIGVLRIAMAAIGVVMKVVGYVLKLIGVTIMSIAWAVEYVMDGIVYGINQFIDGINMLTEKWNALVSNIPWIGDAMTIGKIEHIEKSNIVPDDYGEALSFGQGDSEMASGGIVTGPTRALIGESGSEVVLPLNRLGEVLSRAMRGSGGGGGGGVGVGDVVVPVTINVDGERLGQVQERITARDQRRAMGGGAIGLRGIG